MARVKLATGSYMPIVGLGTYRIKGPKDVRSTLDAALASGYRSLDTASVYNNEADIGTCLQELLPKYGLKRKDIFITSKLAPKDHGDRCDQACLESLARLQCDYLDLYLVHWPGVQGLRPRDQRNKELRKQTWATLEQFYQEGKLKAIGISNYLQHHIEELLTYCTIPPAVLQIEHHPHLVQKKLLQFCVDKGIHFQAYSSLGTSSNSKVLCDLQVKKIAEKYQKSPAQVLLRWSVQQGIGVLPKSTDPQHVAENIDIFDFELSTASMDLLSGLNRQQHYCWDPESVA